MALRKTQKRHIDLTVNTTQGLHGEDIYTHRDVAAPTIKADLDTKMLLVGAATEGHLAVFDAAGQVEDGGAVPAPGSWANYAHKVTSGEITAKKIVFSTYKPSDAANFLAVYITGALEATVDYALTTGESAEFDWTGKSLDGVIAADDLIGFSFKC